MTYGAILCDPPWRFKTWSEKGRDRSPDAPCAKAVRHYNVMPTGEMYGLFDPEWPNEDCVLFMWCVGSMLPDALELGSAWGFRYKGVAFTWVKANAPYGCATLKYPIGLGYWTRKNPEQCLLFTRGRPKRKSKAVRELIIAPRREHSRKPDEQYERIEALVDGPYLEMFARSPHREGWDVWGDQV